LLKECPIVIPDFSVQQHYAQIVRRYERLRAQREALRQAEHLFDTLLHRAFRGELGAGVADRSDESSAGRIATTDSPSGRSAATIDEAGSELVQLEMKLS